MRRAGRGRRAPRSAGPGTRACCRARARAGTGRRARTKRVVRRRRDPRGEETGLTAHEIDRGPGPRPGGDPRRAPEPPFTPELPVALSSGGEAVPWTVRAFNAKGSNDPSLLLPRLSTALYERLGSVPRGLSRMCSGAPIGAVGARCARLPALRVQRTAAGASDRCRGGPARGPAVAARTATVLSEGTSGTWGRASGR